MDFGCETWSGKSADDLPLVGLDPFSDEVFASYTGPEDGLAYTLRSGEKNGNFTNSNLEAAGVRNWNVKDQKAYGICLSLYEQHPVNGKMSGDPIADAFALCARKNNCVLLIADGVNWGEKSRLAARCALYGSMKYINKKLFEEREQPENTQEALMLLRQSFDEAHKTILQQQGGLTTMCACLVCPVKNSQQFAVCCVNVGDSYAYVLSHQYGIRELTVGSHDICSERDIRDAGGALGPVDGKNPELQNLTFALTFVDAGDIVFLLTDGISDNFDPVVTKVALPRKNSPQSSTYSGNVQPEMEPRERHIYAMKEMERVINEQELITEEPCSAQELCGALVQHVLALTDPKRKILENPDLYVRRKLTKSEKERRDSDIIDKMSKAPGKLDHASIVAFDVCIMKPDEEEMENIPLIETISTLDTLSEYDNVEMPPQQSGPLSPNKKSRPKKLFARIRSLSVNSNHSSTTSHSGSSSIFPISPKKISFKRSRSRAGSVPTTPVTPDPSMGEEFFSPRSPMSPTSPVNKNEIPIPKPRRLKKQISYESAV
ncbi:hypothetical protein FSP39_006089 [Pinctada imbricata]|uniref:PPM-type phosphatase domain-containing protein n=1 Tax=Pinctada imbricata TaxID=66713 RepID=A0AA89C9R1_PINIB|nr:hypothetical protein FSP39_006089 [Pinctada imbricata]